LEIKLDELKVSEVISGTSHGFEMLEKYIQTRPNVKITLAQAGPRAVMRAYYAINEADNVVIFANGDGNRTEHAIANTLNEKKNLKIYSYKSKVFDIQQEGYYAKISMNGNIQKSTAVEGIYLDKQQIDYLIERLNMIKENFDT
jgi:hypothetical protein